MRYARPGNDDVHRARLFEYRARNNSAIAMMSKDEVMWMQHDSSSFDSSSCTSTTEVNSDVLMCFA